MHTHRRPARPRQLRRTPRGRRCRSGYNRPCGRSGQPLPAGGLHQRILPRPCHRHRANPGRRPALRHPPRYDDRRAISRPLGLDEPADIRQGDQRSPGFPGRLAPDTRVIVAQPPEWKAITITLVSLRYARPGCMGSHEHPIGGISTSSVRVLGAPAAGTTSRSPPADARRPADRPGRRFPTSGGVCPVSECTPLVVDLAHPVVQRWFSSSGLVTWWRAGVTVPGYLRQELAAGSSRTSSRPCVCPGAL